MKIRPPLFEFDTPNLRSQRQTNTIKTIAKILREGILDRESLQEAFKINKDEISNPIKYNDNSYLVLNVSDIIPVAERDIDQLQKINTEIYPRFKTNKKS